MMFELDHMLNGKGSRSHIEEIAQQIKADRMAHEAEAIEEQEKQATPERSIFSSVVLMITRWA